MTRRLMLFLGSGALVTPLFSKEEVSLRSAAGAMLVLEVEKTGMMAGKKHRFVFAEYHGEVTETASRVGGKQVRFAVRSASIRCEDTWVSDKDRPKIVKYALNEMLEADKYPEIHYVSSGIHISGSDGYSVEGQLTIRDNTRPVTVSAARQADSAGKLWWNGSAVISLSDFGLKAPTAGLGTIGTKDKMLLSFHLASE